MTAQEEIQGGSDMCRFSLGSQISTALISGIFLGFRFFAITAYS
jgi:hypothetical protein